jgi:hypothetical protein
MTNPAYLRFNRLFFVAAISILLLPAPRTAHAQSISTLDAIGQSPDWRRFLQPTMPPHLDCTLFTGGIEAGGFSPQRYQAIIEGTEVEQSLTHGIGLVGRVTGVELLIHGNFSNPLQPSNTGRPRLNFARLQAGFRLKPLAELDVTILGGSDVGDSSAAVIEGDIRYSMFLASEHPTTVSTSTLHDYQNGITSAEIDFRSILFTRTSLAMYAGPAGQIYGGGIVPVTQGQGGGIVGAMLRRYNFGIELQSGYGNAGEYTQLSIFKGFSVRE